MVLVTGATGLVGSHLMLRLLENDKKVRAIYRTEASRDKVKNLFNGYGKISLYDQIEWMLADITDVPSLEPVFEHADEVYHCAAYISFDPKDEAVLRKTNIEGTANIVNFCLAHNVKKLCYVSSIAALGDLKEFEHTITEETEWNPEVAHSDYAISKYGAEMEIWRGQQEGLWVTIVNPGVILGAGFWDSGSGLLFTQVANGLLFYTRGSSGFVYVDDVIESMLRSMNNADNGKRFIVVAENISYEKIVQTIASALNVKTPSLYASHWMTGLYWRLDWVLSLFGKKRILSRLMARSLHQTHEFSNEKVKSDLGIEFHDIEKCILEIGKQYPRKK